MVVQLDRVLATSYKLSIVTMSPSAAVWLQFLMESFELLVAVSRKWWVIWLRVLLVT